MRAASSSGPLTDVLRSAPGRAAPSWGEEFCRRLQGLVGADLVSLNGMDPDLGLAWAVDSPAGTCHGATAEAVARLCATHPVVRWGSRHPGVPCRLGDVQPWSSFRNTELFADLYRPLGLRHEIDVVIAGAAGSVTVALQRTGTDFDPGVEDVLSLLRPILALASSTMWEQYRTSAAEPAATRAGAFRLTQRERQVLALLAEGARDPDIASEYGISPATAKKHVEHILGKLDVGTRAAAVAVGLRHGLIPLR